LKRDKLKIFDNAPGFSWLEADETNPEVIARCIEHVVEASGVIALSDQSFRLGDTGISNTLRALDTIVENSPTLLKEVRPDLRRAIEEYCDPS
jgi:hypothetical protein